MIHDFDVQQARGVDMLDSLADVLVNIGCVDGPVRQRCVCVCVCDANELERVPGSNSVFRSARY